MEILYRKPDESDVACITDVINRSTRELKHHTDICAEEARAMTFGDKDFDSRGFLLAETGGRPVGFGGAIASSTRLAAGYDDASLMIYVVPVQRGSGIEDILMDFAFEYLRSRKIARARMFSYTEGDWRKGLAQGRGMADIRHGYIMRYDKREELPETEIPDGYRITRMMTAEMSDGELARFVETFNDSFADHWNFSRQPADRFVKTRDEMGIRGATFMMAFATKGDEDAGVTFTEVSHKYNEQHGVRAGFINILGVRKPHRRNGLGRALLSDAMNWILEQGMDIVYLGMEAQNSKALKLYLSQGFRVEEESVTYELELLLH